MTYIPLRGLRLLFQYWVFPHSDRDLLQVLVAKVYFYFITLVVFLRGILEKLVWSDTQLWTWMGLWETVLLLSMSKAYVSPKFQNNFSQAMSMDYSWATSSIYPSKFAPRCHFRHVSKDTQSCQHQWCWLTLMPSHWGWRSPGPGCPGRLWSLLLWRYSSPAWTRSCAACSGWPCFSRSWTGWPTEVPSNPDHSVWFCNVHWFCAYPYWCISVAFPQVSAELYKGGRVEKRQTGLRRLKSNSRWSRQRTYAFDVFTFK